MFEHINSFGPHFQYIMEGTYVTLQYSVVSVFFGLILGILLAICKVVDNKLLRIFAVSYTSVFRGTPIIVQISIVYFGLPSLTGIKLDVFPAGVLALSLNSGAYVSEIIRAGIQAVDGGQVEATKALGIPPILRMKDIILPQAMRNILPALVNELTNLIKESALVSVIGGMDLMRRAQLVAAETFDFFLPMITAAAAYYIMIVIISFCAHYAEKRLAL